MMTDAAKAVVWEAVFEPLGSVHAITGSASLNARFPGQWFMLESGLHYNWHRFYDPTTGRYTAPDPLGFVDGPSVYGYAGQSPLMFVDPDGRFFFAAFFGPSIGTALADLAVAGGATWWWNNSHGGPLGRSSPLESRRSDKERATDIPSWSEGLTPDPGESCGGFAERILKEKYGCDDPRAKERGPGSEYSKIKKNCERGSR